MLQIKRMRLPTCEEYDLLAKTAKENNAIMHWDKMYSWCQDVYPCRESSRAVRGCHSARYWSFSNDTYRYTYVGFRPTFDALGSDALLPDGTIVTVGTLYMDGAPSKVPVNPTRDGDIPDFAPGAKLELRAAVEAPAYQVKAIKAGTALIADRVLLRNISWDDLHQQGLCKGFSGYISVP